MKLININTTAYKEEDFMLYTSLTDDQIIKVIEPLVLAEREDLNNDDVFYNNQILVRALYHAYPDEIIHDYTLDDINQITI